MRHVALLTAALAIVITLLTMTPVRTDPQAAPAGKGAPASAPEAKERQKIWREYQLALLQPTDACKNKERSCAGGTYGPPSPWFDKPAPIYPVGGVNRSSDPEDHGLLVRCLGGYMPAGGE